MLGVNIPSVYIYVTTDGVHAAQSHNIVNNIMRLAVRHRDIVVDGGYTLHGVYPLTAMLSNP